MDSMLWILATANRLLAYAVSIFVDGREFLLFVDSVYSFFQHKNFSFARLAYDCNTRLQSILIKSNTSLTE